METKFDFGIYVKEKTKPMAKKIVVPKAVINKLKGIVSIDKIVISPFEVLDYYPNAPVYNYNEVNEDYIFINSRLFSTFIGRCNPTMFKLLSFIMFSIKPNSNLIKINQRQVAAMLGNYSNFYPMALDKLESFGVIARTNKLFYFIINHNIFFKGNINEFAKNYKEKYDGIDVKVDEKGKVIIDNRPDYNSSKYKNRKVMTIDEFNAINHPVDFINQNLIGGKPIFGKYSDKKVIMFDNEIE